MNNFILFVGVPCSGKSTFIDQNQLAITATYGVDAVLSSDAVVEDVASTRGLTYSEVFRDSIDLATKYVENMIGIFSLQQRNFILDGTNLTAKARKRKLSLLTHPQNYNKIAVVFSGIDQTVLDDRHNARHESGKIIPPEVLKEMSDRFTLPTQEEGFNAIFTPEEFLKTFIKSDTYGGGLKFA